MHWDQVKLYFEKNQIKNVCILNNFEWVASAKKYKYISQNLIYCKNQIYVINQKKQPLLWFLRVNYCVLFPTNYYQS